MSYEVIIETNAYSGFFKREMTAYCTGIIGDCKVGKDYINKKIVSLFEKDIKQVTNDKGVKRPCSMDPKDCMSFSIFFNKKPTTAQINLIKERAEKYKHNEHCKHNQTYNIGIVDIKIKKGEVNGR